MTASLALALILAGVAITQWIRLARLVADNRAKVGDLVNDVRLGRPANFHDAAALLGSESGAALNDLVAMCSGNNTRDNQLRALGTSADAVLERHERLSQLLQTHQDAVGETQAAAQTANTGISLLNTGAVELANSVADSSAAIEQTFASIKIVSDNMGSLADTVNNVSAAIGELAVSINHVAGNAQEANQLSLQADEKARDGGKAVERLVESTREIATDIRAVVAKMEELGSASAQISNIVEVIDTIADQTNLLALNAAIEAARAGEHGRGFAVVADEVRKLAENSASSTKEIGHLVKDIQAKTGEVVRSTTASGNKASTGLQMADLAGRAISDILDAVSEASRLIEQISNAAREQAAGSTAIVNSVEQMNDLMREAARSLDEQNVSNQAMTMTVTHMQRLTDQVTGAIEQQRVASRAIEQAAEKLEQATHSSIATSAEIEEAAVSLRSHVSKLLGDQGSLGRSSLAQLAGSRN
ncbi:MAG: methyl-accepting chemotaxis protein [Candidatus Eremiobacteraeota bacterium]|nr:methyl-accepting chemotaxis protein [Candidatus Eremiobacteraeota bacterium]